MVIDDKKSRELAGIVGSQNSIHCPSQYIIKLDQQANSRHQEVKRLATWITET